MTAEIVRISEPLEEEEVWAACEALKAEGQPITRRSVAKRVGRGSMTTITRMVSSWEDKQTAHAEARDVELTAEDTETILTFGRLMLRTLTERIRQEAAEETARLEEKAEEERRRASDLAAAYDDLTAEKRADLERLKAEADQEALKLKAEIDDLSKKLNELQSDYDAAALVASNLNQDLLRETDRADREKTRADEAEGKIASANLAAADAEGRVRLLTEKVTEKELALRDAEERASKLSTQCELAVQNAQTANSREQESRDDLKRQNQEVSRLNAEVARLSAELRAASEKFSDSEERLRAANSRVDELLHLVRAERPNG